MVCRAARRTPASETEPGEEDLLTALQALADPHRLRIVLMLRRREQCVCHLTESLGLSQATVSHHLAVLKRAGLVRARRDPADARWVHYSLGPTAPRLGRTMIALLDADAVDPTPADCSGR